MELITAILLAGPLGYVAGNRKRALVLYLMAWTIVFPIQSVVVHSENVDDINVMYFVVNALILSFGIVLNQLGVMVRRRRAAGRVMG